LKYRAEIDGLRAIAVVAVILFHAGFEVFSGGFVGVDVFFVISGYLITTILIEEIENNRFSIFNFYERRARRILPGLFFVMLVCIPFAWMWMLPSQMEAFSKSLVAVCLFASNILFWRENRYWNAASVEKPLLHTWSLSVEEQYYVLFPIFLFLVWRFGRNRVFWMIVVFAAMSLALTEWGWFNEPTANFYLLPSRAFELLAGSMAAFLVQKRGVQANNPLSLLGLAAILFAFFVYDQGTPLPSLYTLVPVIGVVLLVLFAEKETLTAKLLSTKLFVGIGLISYSAYLWHQPLFAFARIRSFEEPTPVLMLTLILLSLVLAYFSWKYIEKPFRDKNKIKRQSVFLLSVSFTLIFISIGIFGYKNDGFRDQSKLKDSISFNMSKLIDKDILVFGDSHAAHLIHGLENVTSGVVKVFASAGCIPLRNVDRYDFRFFRGNCANKMNTFLDEVIEKDPNALILLASMGPVYLDGTTFKGKDIARVTGNGVELVTNKDVKDKWKVYEIGLRTTFLELSQLQNAKTVFVIDVPELGIDFGCRFDSKVLRTSYFEIGDLRTTFPTSNCKVSRQDYDNRADRYKKLVYSVASELPSVLVFDPTEYFCFSDNCIGYRKDIGYIYEDADHLGQSGSNFWAYNFVNWFNELNK
jgi:peptidoglycan/LPS O-acetylase OafA/YrhL